MIRIPVSSSNLATVGYDPQQEILEIEFGNRSVYQYFNVPQQIYNGLINAGSHGRYFDRHIKKGGYRYHRIQ